MDTVSHCCFYVQQRNLMLLCADEVLASCSAEAIAPWETVVYKFEPFVLHIRCEDLEAGQKLLRVALECGLKNSGMVPSRQPMVAIRSTHRLEIPIALSGRLMVSHEYLTWITTMANEKLQENFLRIDKLFAAIQAALPLPPPPPPTPPPTQDPVPLADLPHACTVCPERFSSRNKLFTHLHAVHAPPPSAPS
eukprot:m.47872 g.47872  ORF g.47872 m.47872 type:complete len:193 (-) comp11315_c0_seq1:87-665(-)